MSLCFSRRLAQTPGHLQMSRCGCRRLGGASAPGVRIRKAEDPSSRAMYAWKCTLATTPSPRRWALAHRRSLRSQRAMGGCRRLSGEAASKQNSHPPSSNDPPSLIQRIRDALEDPATFVRYVRDEIDFTGRWLHHVFAVKLPVFLPRFVAWAAALQLTMEYGLRAITCEGPSMEPTIVDGSHTVVLIERWSHRLFGLEKDGCAVDDNRINGPREVESQHEGTDEESDYSIESSRALLRGIWEQHFASGLDRGDVIILDHPLKEGTVCKRIIGMPGDAIVRTDGGDGDGDESGHVVPPGHLWIEGDNSLNSLDSRSYGTVPASLVIGTVVCRLFPLREYVSSGLDGNGVEHFKRVDARIGRDRQPAGEQREANRSYVLPNKREEKSR